MENDFYNAFKQGLDSKNFDFEFYENLIDEYLQLLECKGSKCRKLQTFKNSLECILNRHKKLQKQKDQNEEIFSQILHDIKSPMLGVKFVLDGTKRTELENEIYTVNLNVLTTIQDFLTLYSFKDGFKTLDFKYTNPYELIKNELLLYDPLLRQKALKVDFDMQTCLKVCTSRAVFERIVSNLLSNAIKYAPYGSDIKIKFFDNEKNFIFKISNLLSDTRTEPALSFGMGLTIVKRLARRIKSTVCTKRGKGEITFELKMLKADYPDHER